MSPEGDEVASLIRAARAQDREAFSQLYQLTCRPVFRYVSARVPQGSDAEELTQEVFMAALRGIESLRAEDQVGLMAWLLQIARHKLADSLRASYRSPTSPIEELPDIRSELLEPEEALTSSINREELRRALQQLTAEQREVVLCKYVLGYDNETTARHLDKNSNAVNQLHRRALASLRRLIPQEPVA